MAVDMTGVGMAQFANAATNMNEQAAASTASTDASTKLSIMNEEQGVELAGAKQGEELSASTAQATASVAKTWSSMAGSV